MDSLKCRLAIIFWFATIFSCESPSSSAKSIPKTSPDAETLAIQEMDKLYRAIWRTGKLNVIYGDGNAEITEKYKELVSKAVEGNRRIKVNMMPASLVADSLVNTEPTLLIGTSQSNLYIERWLESTPFKKTTNGFQFDGQEYNESSHLFSLGVYPNPVSDSVPLAILGGNDDLELIANLTEIYQDDWRRMLWNNWGYQVYDGSQRLILGQFGQIDGKPWQIDKKIHWDFGKNQNIIHQSKHFKLVKHGALDTSLLNNLLPQSEEAIQRIENFTGKKIDINPIAYHAYATSEEKGLLTNNTSQSHIQFERMAVHTVVNAEYLNNFIGEENRITLRKLLGKPKTDALETGLTLHFAPQWQKEGYQYWALRLYSANFLVPLSELFDNEWFEKESRLVFDCMAGVAVDFLLSEWGKDAFLEKYTSWEPQPDELKELEAKWDMYFKTILQQRRDNAKPFQVFIPEYFKGFNFAHEGYSIYNGYNSKESNKSLDTLTSIHSNAVAIVPYSYMRDPKKPSFLSFARFAGGETDESVVHVAFEAKKRKMHTLLKPQVWLGSNSWPGDVEMTSEEDWAKFFNYYSRWMRHYALLAEIHQIDMLCLGVEFAKATLTKPQKWMELARKAKKIYSGKLTYAANWGAEAEKCTIWPAFDYIGVNCYYPLSKKEKPSKQELSKNFSSTLNMLKGKLEIFKKPIIFTEIGFRSIEKTWLKPHAQPEGKAFENEAQAQCYQVVFENLNSHKDWIKGVFWWKWPSYLIYSDKQRKGFTPANRKAQFVVSKWFKRM